MHDLQKKELDRALVFLSSIGCKYKVSHPEGIDFTNIVEEVVKKRSRKASIYPRGSVSSHVKKHIENIGVGEIRLIPFDPYDKRAVCSTTTGYMSSTYGNKSYTSRVQADGIEVMRIF